MLDFGCHSQNGDSESTEHDAAIVTITLKSLAVPTDADSKNESPADDPAAGTDAFRKLVKRFREYACNELESGDPSELHNAAVRAASEWHVRGSTLRRVLAVIALKRPEFKEAVSDWRDSDAGDPDHTARQMLSDKQLNVILAKHAIDADWDNASVARELYRVQIAANQFFFGAKLPLCVISLKPTANGSRSSLRTERNGLGVKYEINLNLKNIGDSRRRRAAHVVHELLHLREALFEGGSLSYHSRTFRERASAIGIPTSTSGAYLGIVPNSPLDGLLRYLNIGGEDDSKGVASGPASMGARGSRQKKLVPWHCGCTTIYAEQALVVSGRCTKESCGKPWTLMNSGKTPESNSPGACTSQDPEQ